MLDANTDVWPSEKSKVNSASTLNLCDSKIEQSRTVHGETGYGTDSWPLKPEGSIMTNLNLLAKYISKTEQKIKDVTNELALQLHLLCTDKIMTKPSKDNKHYYKMHKDLFLSF